MSDQYTRDLLRVAVAQICQTIGYNATQTSSLELLQDLLHRFLNEFARDMRRQVEHDNRTMACLDDVALTFSSLNININEILDYIGNVEPIPFAIDVPKFPIKKPSNLNFLKPGSQEVLSRPVHIFEHLPPMLPPDNQTYPNEETILQNKSMVGYAVPTESSEENKSISSISKKIKFESDEPNSSSSGQADFKSCYSSIQKKDEVPTLHGKPLQLSEDHGRPAREIISVVMTTGGFISPAIEGKLPEPGIPAIVEKYFGLDAPPPLTPPLPPPPQAHSTSESSKADKIFLDTNIKQSSAKEIITKKAILPIDRRETLNKSSESGAVSSKKNVSKANQLQQPTTAALKLLKKAKKKNVLSVEANLAESNIQDVLMQNSDKLNEKARRKRLKMLQKMLKNSHKVQSGNDLGKKEGKKSKLLSQANAAQLLAEIPSDIERERLEKMLKKQAKQKQKELKKQMIMMETQRKNLPEPATAAAAQMLYETTSSMQSSTSLLESTNNLQKIEQKCESKQSTPTSMPISLLKSYDKNALQTSGESTQPAQVDCIQTSMNDFPTDMQMGSLPSTDAAATATAALEIKLSNEPDRNKLNIFKKISKSHKATPPSSKQSALSSLNSFTGSEGQIINLPSGTTITPAPIPFPTFHSSNLTPVNAQAQGPAKQTNATNQEATLDLSTKSQHNLEINKPKKRGRKPGSKNQPKVLPIINPSQGPGNQDQILNPLGAKKQKKNKLANALKFDQMTDSSSSSLLSNSLSTGIANEAARFPKFDPYSIVSQPNIPQHFPTQPPLKAPRKVRKDKEKLKPLEVFPGGPPDIDIKVEQKSPLGFGGANHPMNPLNLLFKNNMEQQQQQSLIALQQKPRKRSTSQVKAVNPTNVTLLPPYLAGGQTSGFPQINASNMLSMLPFAFPPRPGLIPTPTLFPPTAAGLTNFPSQLPNAGGNPGLLGLSQPFFPFPNMKSQKSPVLSQLNDNPKERTKDAVPFLSNERSYCNVAPLVPPESMQHVTESSGYGSSSAAKQTKINANKDCTFSPSVTSTHLVGNLQFEQANASNILRKVSTITSVLPPTQLKSNSFSTLNDCKEKHTPSGAADDPIEVSDDSDETNIISTDASTRNSFNAGPTQMSNPTLMDLSPPNASIIKTDAPIQDAITTKKLKKNQKHSKKIAKTAEVSSESCLESFGSNCTSGTDIGKAGGDGFSKLAGGADLIPIAGTGSAYSAKSIPSTSLTASSRALNMNVASSAFEHTGKEFNADPNPQRFNDVTIIANVQKKKSKEHKKLRKSKDGDVKVKKKKDKKDKLKEKSTHETSALTHEETIFENQVDKETMKKLKKERKKQKQRLLGNSNEPQPPPPPPPTQAYFPNPTLSSQIPVNTFGNKPAPPQLAQNIQQPPSILSTIPPTLPMSSIPTPTVLTPAQSACPPVSTSTFDASSVSLVPKLTLKIGSSHSPLTTKMDDDAAVDIVTKPNREPSPELARFSPLVTRPPKQKYSQNENPIQPSNVLSSENPQTFNTKPFESTTPIVPQIPPSPWLSGGTLTANSVLLPQQLISPAAKSKSEQYTMSTKTENTSQSINANPPRNATNNSGTPQIIAETNRPSSYVDADGNTVWICPACGKVDDGSPMIGCDGCDAWYHWECVGIVVAPNDNEDWFCRVCITRKKGFHSGGEGTEKKRKKNKKK